MGGGGSPTRGWGWQEGRRAESTWEPPLSSVVGAEWVPCLSPLPAAVGACGAGEKHAGGWVGVQCGRRDTREELR